MSGQRVPAFVRQVRLLKRPEMGSWHPTSGGRLVDGTAEREREREREREKKREREREKKRKKERNHQTKRTPCRGVRLLKEGTPQTIQLWETVPKTLDFRCPVSQTHGNPKHSKAIGLSGHAGFPWLGRPWARRCLSLRRGRVLRLDTSVQIEEWDDRE